MTLIDINPSSVTSEWLQLETAVDIMGQVIAYYVALIAQERQKESPDQQTIQQAKELIDQIGQEQNACYRSATRDLMIQKAFTEYAPFLKGLK